VADAVVSGRAVALQAGGGDEFVELEEGEAPAAAPAPEEKPVKKTVRRSKRAAIVPPVDSMDADDMG
jgi:hypothetical protein